MMMQRMQQRRSGAVVLFSAAFLATAWPVLDAADPAARQAAAASACETSSKLVRIAELPEASGLAASRKTPGRFWSHNDSGEPVLFALDSAGVVTGRLQLTGAAVEDWEAVAVGPCPAGSCIYVGDIGDNDAERAQVTIYRVTEPAEASSTARVTGVFRARYPDGAHDAEALLVDASGRLHIVTKGDTGPVALYRFPSTLKSDGTMQLERVGNPRTAGENDRITDGSVSPDGQWIVLRTRHALTFYRSADLLAGNWRTVSAQPVASLGEPQGEGVAFGAGARIYLVSEGGGKKQPGAFASLSCRLDS